MTGKFYLVTNLYVFACYLAGMSICAGSWDEIADGI